MTAIPKKFKQFCKKFKDDESIFGFFYKKVGSEEILGISGGDWMNEDTYLPIDEWCAENKIVSEYETEVSDEYFINRGFQPIKL